MIELSEKHYISEGLARVCYRHPENSNYCIKIGKPEVEIEHLYKEINYFKKLKNKNRSKFDYQFYADYHGEIETNLGTGFIYDLIKDEITNEVSLTLRHYLEMQPSPISDEDLVLALGRLKNEMIRHKVFVGDLRARNLCCKKLKNNIIELIVIDGIGHRDFFPFADYSTYFARKKVERRFLKSNLHSLEAQRQLIKRLRAAGETIV